MRFAMKFSSSSCIFFKINCNEPSFSNWEPYHVLKISSTLLSSIEILFSFLKFSQLSSIHLFLKIFFFCKDGEQTKVEKAKQIYILPKFSDFFCVVYYSFNYCSFFKNLRCKQCKQCKMLQIFF